MLSPALCATGLGLFAHWGVFIRGEWHLAAPNVASLHIAVFLWSVTWRARYNLEDLSTSLATVFLWCSCYGFGLFASVTIYRFFFHRLRVFPGPKLAAITKFWHLVQCLDSRNYQVLEKVNQEHGSIVRTGGYRCFLCELTIWIVCRERFKLIRFLQALKK